MMNLGQLHRASRRTLFASGIAIFACTIVFLALTQSASAQNPAVNTLVFDSGTQIYRLDLDVNSAPIPSSLFTLASAASPQQAQEPQWSLAASPLDGGRIVYQFGASGVRGLHIVRPDGTGDVQLTPPPSSGYVCTDARDPSWSPDGRYIAYACLVAPLNNYDIWIHDTNGTPDNTSDDSDYPLLTLPSQEFRPAWSPDGTMIAFVTSAPGHVGVGPNSKIAVVQITIVNGNVQPFVGTNGVLLTDDTFTNFSPSWSPDSQQIAFSTTRSGGHDIYRMSARYGEGDPSTFFRLTTSPANDTNPAWSPDGRTIAFTSDRSGSNQIWLMSAVAGDTDTFDLHQITNDSLNDNDAAWKPNSIAPSNSLTLIVPAVVVTSGVARPTGSGTVTVTDGFGHVVVGAIVTIVAPSSAGPDLAFGLPSPVKTDLNGQLMFTTMQATAQTNTADYQFAVAASDPATGKTGAATAIVRVFGGGAIIPPQPPGPIPVPTQTRLPVGRPPFSPQQKAIFAQLAGQFSQKVAEKTKVTTGLSLAATGGKYFEPLYEFLTPVVGSVGVYDVFELEMIALDYTYALNLQVLANDPPDPNFTQVALPQVKAPPIIAIGGGPLSPNSVNLMNQNLATKALLKAYLDTLTTSVNRYSTAISAGDLTSAALQRNAILAYEDALTPLFQNDASVTQQLLTSFQLAGLPNVQLGTSDVAALQNAIATNGLPSEMVQILEQLGLTPNDVTAIQNSFVNTPASSLTGSTFSELQIEAATFQTSAVTFAQLSPAVPPTTPIVTVIGGTLPYDGAAHGASASAVGVSGSPVSGSFTFTYTPGGSSPPVNVGTYSVTAQFTSADLTYTNASGTAVITITPAPVQTPTTTPTGRMQFPRVSHQATLMSSGLVLVSGGQNSGSAIGESELYNPATGTWSLTGNNVIPRFDHTATLLADGRVLATGGVSSTGDCTSNVTAETYDPAKGTWSLTGRLPSPVGTGHIAVLLLDGRVLVSGGGDRCGNVFNTAAIFDPSTNKWSATGNMTAPRGFHSAALLPDGRVLVAGGTTSSPFSVVASAEIYDPKAGVWTAISSMGTARQTSCNGYTQPYLASLSGGTVLAAGGFSGPNCSSITPKRTVSSLTVSPSPALLSGNGQTLALTVSAQMSDASTQLFTGPLQFSSADTTVATVNSNGLIASVGAGTTSITVTASGIAPVTVTTTVATRALTSIAVSPPSITLIGAGQTQPLAINGQYSDGSQQALTSGVTFVSSNPAVASVDATGLITSGGNGTAMITASAQGAPAVQVSVTVKSLVSIVTLPTSISFNAIGQVQAISVIGQFTDGSQQILAGTPSFLSSDPTIARVDLGGNVTAVNFGTATITVAVPNLAAVQVPVTIAPIPVLLSANPNSAKQGQQNFSVSLTGQFTNWVQTATTANFGPGIAVATLTVNSPTTATASINIDPTATPGSRTIMLTTGTEIETLANGFTVVAQTAVLVSVNPPTGQLGQQNFSVSLTGQFTNWVQGNTTASFGAGITISSLTVNSPISATAVLTIDPATTIGPRTVALTTGSEVASLVNGFAVSGGPMETDAKPFSVLNLAGVTGGHPIQLEADPVPFSVLNTAGPGGSGGLFEIDTLDFSTLNLAGMSGNQPVKMEADGVPFSVKNGP